MLNRMIKTGIASVALAASAVLIATPASASPLAAPVALKSVGQWGQSAYEVQRLTEEALYACECQLAVDSISYGYRDASIKNYEIQQIGYDKFKIYATAKLFDGYGYQAQQYDCLVKGGRLLNASHLTPVVHKRSRRGFNRGFGRRGFRNSGFSFRFGY